MGLLDRERQGPSEARSRIASSETLQGEVEEHVEQGSEVSTPMRWIAYAGLDREYVQQK